LTHRAVFLVSVAGFATALFARAVDPIIPPIAADLRVDPQAVALLASAFALPFALIPPVFGPIADVYGKFRLIFFCLVLLMLSGVLATFAPSYEVLLVARVMAGVAAGGIFPISLAIVADLVPVGERQIAIGKLLSVVITGNLLGAAAAGAIGDIAGWRAVFVAVTLCGAAASLALLVGLRAIRVPEAPRPSLRSVPASYRKILANPRAKVCYAAVFIEGAVVFGVIPYVALLLLAAGEDRAMIAGLVIGAFSLGGVGYSLVVRRLLRRFRPTRLMQLGACLAALALAAASQLPPWAIQLVAFFALGFGFYSLHGYIQVQASELSETARGAAMSLHSSAFFLGQGTGPVLYGLGFSYLGTGATILIAAVTILLLGIAVARQFADRLPVAVQPQA
jgi:predicted MFS family arabinose efflux permease